MEISRLIKKAQCILTEGAIIKRRIRESGRPRPGNAGLLQHCFRPDEALDGSFVLPGKACDIAIREKGL